MPDAKRIVINTSPLIALVAAMGDFAVLQRLYVEVLVPYEVSQEILVDNASRFAAAEFDAAKWLTKQPQPIEVSPLLSNALGRGEASVIQLALDAKIQTVCIDEALGRRFARLSGLSVTGSIGILLRAKQQGEPIVMKDAIARMQSRGIRLSQSVVDFALQQAGERF